MGPDPLMISLGPSLTPLNVSRVPYSWQEIGQCSCFGGGNKLTVGKFLSPTFPTFELEPCAWTGAGNMAAAVMFLSLYCPCHLLSKLILEKYGFKPCGAKRLSGTHPAEGTNLEMISHDSHENKMRYANMQEAEDGIQVNKEEDEFDIFSWREQRNSDSCMTKKEDFSLFSPDVEFGSLQSQLRDADDEGPSVGEDSDTKDLVEQNSTSALQLGTEGMRFCHPRAAHHNGDIGTEFHLNSGSILLDDISYAYEETLNLCRTDSVLHSSADADNSSLSTTVLEYERELNQDDTFVAARESKVENSSTKHVFSSCEKQNDVAAAVWAHKSETCVRPENEFHLSGPLCREPLVISRAHISAGHADKGQSLRKMLKYIYCLSLDPFYTGAGHSKFVCDNVLRFRRLVYKSVPNLVSLECILDYNHDPKLHDLRAMDPLSCPSPTRYAIKTEPIYEVGIVNEMTGKNQLLLHSSDDKTGMDECSNVSAAANTEDYTSNIKAIINHLTCPVKNFEDVSIGKRMLDFPGASNLPFKLQKTQPPLSVHGSRIDSSVTERKPLRPRNPADSDLAYQGTVQSHQDMLRHLHCLALDLFYSGKENLKSVKKMILRYRALFSLNIPNLVSSECTSFGGHALRSIEASELSRSGSSPRRQDCTSVAMSCPDYETGFANGGNNKAQLFADGDDDSTKIHPREKVGAAMHDVDQEINTKEVDCSAKHPLDRFSGSVLGKRRIDDPVASDPLKLLKSGSSSASASDSIMVIPRFNIDAQNLSDLAFVEHISCGVYELETSNLQQKMSILQPPTHFTDSVANIHLDSKVCLEDDAVTEIQLVSHGRDKGAKKPCAKSIYLGKVNGTSEKRGVICSSDDMQKCVEVGIGAIGAPPYVKVDIEPKATEISQLSCEISDNSQKISSEVSCSGPHRESTSRVVHRKRRHAPLVHSRLSFNSQLGHLYASPFFKDGLNAMVDDQKMSKMGKFPGGHVCLHMKFPKDFSLPTKDELIKKFSVFGPLDVSSSRVFFYTGSAQVIFLHQHNAEAACLHARKKNLFGKANVRFWLSNWTGAQPSLPVAVQPACKSCLKTSNVDQRQLAGLKSLTENPDNPLPLMTLQKKRSVTFSGLSGYCNFSGEEKPDISLQMLLLLEKCDQMVCKIRENLGLGSYFSIFMYMSSRYD